MVVNIENVIISGLLDLGEPPILAELKLGLYCAIILLKTIWPTIRKSYSTLLLQHLPRTRGTLIRIEQESILLPDFQKTIKS